MRLVLAGALAMTSAGAQQAPAPAICMVPAETQIRVEIAAPVSSKRAKPGDRFPIRLAQPLVLGGVTVVAAGASGEGEVIHAAPVKFMSTKPGELILAARFVEVGGTRLPLRGFRINASGEKTTTLVSGGGVAAMAQSGHNIEIPAGSSALARVSADTALPCAPSPAG